MLLRIHVLAVFAVICLVALLESVPNQEGNIKPVRTYTPSPRHPVPAHPTTKKIVRKPHPQTRRTTRPFASPRLKGQPRFLADLSDEDDIQVNVVLKKKKHNHLALE
ncbi:unnamed protein product [Bursaphelenchus xylophilus]|uniref:(pine wood nematode) hypothetical protein n=1 Tax=Bursaphelenchus xylophilus TaxID=6326 RepID=A0A1I7SFP7_BURXY|nr:unnamed protein product [Bursaphelenchus xylophilus]CAG9131892.1 unnamed protein product [Bursaphelenchus xylophilus]